MSSVFFFFSFFFFNKHLRDTAKVSIKMIICIRIKKIKQFQMHKRRRSRLGAIYWFQYADCKGHPGNKNHSAPKYEEACAHGTRNEQQIKAV